MEKKVGKKRLLLKTICIIAAAVVFAVIAAALVFMRCESHKDFYAFGLRLAGVDEKDYTPIASGSLVIIKRGQSYSDGTQVEAIIKGESRITSAGNVESSQITGTCVALIPFLGAVLDLISETPVIGTLLVVLFVLLCIIIATGSAAKNKMQKSERTRTGIQFLFSAATNSFIAGFAKGTIYKGQLKTVCLPGLNCYSCPGAYGACPIGAMQAVFNKRQGILSRIPFYVLGLIMLFGTICGRFICGFLCPFGLVQDLLYKIPLPQKLKIKTFKADKYLRYVKYAILVVFVIILPLVTVEAFPWFCKLICPSGMLLGGIPLMSANEGLRSAAGVFTLVKLSILACVIVLSVMIYRAFCKYICPLGAIYGLLNKVSLYHYELDKSKCTNCGACARSCDMGVDLTKNINSAECIRCGKCINVCHTGALKKRFGLKNKAEGTAASNDEGVTA